MTHSFPTRRSSELRMGPHRLEAQDGALSRRKPGFESPWGRQVSAKMLKIHRNPTKVRRRVTHASDTRREVTLESDSACYQTPKSLLSDRKSTRLNSSH